MDFFNENLIEVINYCNKDKYYLLQKNPSGEISAPKFSLREDSAGRSLRAAKFSRGKFPGGEISHGEIT